MDSEKSEVKVQFRLSKFYRMGAFFSRSSQVEETNRTIEISGNRYELLQDNTAILVQFGENIKNILIPHCINYNGAIYNIIDLGNKPFKGCRINTLSFDSDSYISNLRKNAFSGSYIGRLILPQSIQYIEPGALRNKNVRKVYLDNNFNFICNSGIIYNITSVNLLYSSKYIKHITLCECVKNIKAYSFENTFLETIEFPSSLQTIEHKAFNNCTLLKTIIFRKSNTKIFISENAFTNCMSLNHISCASIYELCKIHKIWNISNYITKITFKPTIRKNTSTQKVTRGVKMLNIVKTKNLISNESSIVSIKNKETNSSFLSQKLEFDSKISLRMILYFQNSGKHWKNIIQCGNRILKNILLKEK